MKKIFYLILFFYSNFNSGQPDQEKFLMANKLYNEGNFADAFNTYDCMAFKGFEILFNMGNSLYKLNKYSYAIAYWTKARKYASFEDFSKVENNIDQAYKKLEREKKYSLFGKIIKFSVRYLSLFSLFMLQLIFLISWYLIVLIWKKLIAKHHVILVLLFVINGFTFSCILIKYFSQTKKYAIIVEQSKIFAGPDKTYHTLGIIDLTNEVKIIENKNQWTKISANNLVGWVPDNVLVTV